MPVVLVGTEIEGRANFMTVGWASRANANPPMISVGINKKHKTPEGILKNRTFSVNVPDADMAKATDYCGLVSGAKTDKSGVFETFSGELKGAPMISECPVTMECELVETVELPTNYLFVGEIKGVYADEDCTDKNRPDMKKADAMVLTMTDNRYWRLGEFVDKAWGCGKGYTDEKKDKLCEETEIVKVKKDRKWIKDAVREEVRQIVDGFNRKYLDVETCYYIPRFQGKKCFLDRFEYGRINPLCCLTYNGDIDDWDFAIYLWSDRCYDDEAIFPGEEFIDGTIAGAMKAGMKAYPEW